MEEQAVYARGLLGQMETPRRDRCHQAKSSKPGRSTCHSRTGGLRIPPRYSRNSLFHWTLLGAVGNEARIGASALKKLTD